MKSKLLTAALVASGVLVTIASTLLAQRSAAPTPADTTARIVASAQAMLAALDMSGRAKVQFPFDGPQKTRWSNLPSPMFERRGLRIGDLTAAQKTAVMNLLATALSKDGYQKVLEIMHGDEVLRTNGGGRGGGGRGGAGRGGGGPAFGEAEYYLAFLGTPSTT